MAPVRERNRIGAIFVFIAISRLSEKPAAHDGVFAAEWLPLDHSDIGDKCQNPHFSKCAGAAVYIGVASRQMIS